MSGINLLITLGLGNGSLVADIPHLALLGLTPPGEPPIDPTPVFIIQVRAMSTTVSDGEQILKDPSDESVHAFTWDVPLAVGVELADEGAFTVTAVEPREASPTLTISEESLSGDGRSVRFKLSGGRRGTLYSVAHAIDTDETPSQHLERSFFVLVEDL